MHTMFAQYEERLTRRQAKENTLRNLRRTAALFASSGLDPQTARDWEIEEWFAKLELSPRTKRLHVENLNAVYGYAVHRGLLTSSPMEAVRLPREPDREPHILERDELRAVLNLAVTDQDVLLAYLLVYTGMRKNEIRTLEWENVKPSDNTITVVNGKGDKLRHVPIHPALGEVLAECGRPTKHETVLANARGRALSITGIFNRLERIRGTVDCSFHDFRRTVATSLAENDVPERIIDAIMGWAPRTVGRRYYIRRADAKLQEAILKLYADAPLR